MLFYRLKLKYFLNLSKTIKNMKIKLIKNKLEESI